MLVSHLHKFIYTKTRKTGGTAIEAYFERFCIPAGQWSLQHHRQEYRSEYGIVGARGPMQRKRGEYWSHMPAARIREKIGPAVWEKYRKFCAIRNPFDKVISAYYFNRFKKRGFVDFYSLDREREALEQWLVEGRKLPVDREMYLIAGQFCLDMVIRYEALTADLERVCASLGLPWIPSALPRLKVGYTPAGFATADLYTDRSRRIVEDAFSFELQFFSYTFPNEAGRVT